MRKGCFTFPNKKREALKCAAGRRKENMKRRRKQKKDR